LDRILCALCPTLNDTPGAHSPLSIRALRFLLAHEQVGTIFTGMRDPLYVKDALFAAKQDIIDDEDRDDIWRCPIF
jgi:predicted aldo/keto reductase-like oxidoreductase